MGVRYVIFMGRNLMTRKKHTPLPISIGVGINNENSENSVGVFQI
jgi:hypothetical protein